MAMVVVVMVVVMVVAVMIEEVAVALVEVVVSSGMILCLQKARFSCFLKKRYGQTDGRTDGHTDGWTDGRADRPSYRDARTHLKMSDFPIPILTSCLQSVIAPKRIDQF